MIGVVPHVAHDGRAVKYFMEYLYSYDAPILMKADLDMSIVTIDKMTWEQSGDEANVFKYEMELYEIQRIPTPLKFANMVV